MVEGESSSACSTVEKTSGETVLDISLGPPTGPPMSVKPVTGTLLALGVWVHVIVTPLLLEFTSDVANSTAIGTPTD